MYAFSLEDGAELGEYLEDFGSADEDVTVDLAEVALDEWVAVYLYDGEDASEQWVLMALPDFSD